MPGVFSLSQKAPGRVLLVTLEPGVDDAARGSIYGHFLSGLHSVPQVGQAAVWVHLKLLLFLCSDSLLVPFSPGGVVDVHERLVSCGDPSWTEQLQLCFPQSSVELIILTAPAPESVRHPVTHLVVPLGEQQYPSHIRLVVI